MKFRKHIRVLCCVVPLLAGTGCVSNRYLAPVTSFRDKTGQTIGVIGDFYSSRNSYELDTYLQTVATDGSLALATVDPSGRPTPLGKPVFSPASIKARLDALDLIGVYAGRLYDMASTDAPAKFQEAAAALGSNLGSLDKTFQSLQGASDPTANRYIGPVSQLVGAIGKMFLEHKRDQLIKEGVDSGAPVVDKILSLVRDDMDKIFSLQVVTGANEQLATLTVAYNRDREKLTYEQRVARLKEIKAAAAEAAASVGSAPSALVTSMMTAHKALIAAVTSDSKSKITNLAQLSAALDHWTTQIQSLSAQVRMLIH
jgi:hypothetical protein